MVVRTLLKLKLLVRKWNKGDNSNLVSAVAYLDTGKYPAWIRGYFTLYSMIYPIFLVQLDTHLA
jgi:hypothetical protein